MNYAERAAQEHYFTKCFCRTEQQEGLVLEAVAEEADLYAEVRIKVLQNSMRLRIRANMLITTAAGYTEMIPAAVRRVKRII